MRKGVNPEKRKQEVNQLKLHRIIIPVHIPNVQEEYYKESLEVFDHCLNSLVRTIDHRETAITIIINNCTPSIDPIIEKFLKKIDKTVWYTENKGKVYAVLTEAKAAFEPYVTIADADVIFRKGWEEEIFKIFREYPRAGIVSPVPSPNNSFHFNCSLFFDNYLTGKLKYGKIIKQRDIDLYRKSHSTNILDRNNRKYSWGEKQYYLNGKYKAIAGASHFVATYKTFLFHKRTEFPELKFQNSYEEKFLDNIADLKGYYRLSTNTAFAYHMGNALDNSVAAWENNILERKEDKTIVINREVEIKSSFIPYVVKKLIFKVLHKFNSL